MSTNRIVTGHDAAGLAELKQVGVSAGSEPFIHTPGFAVSRIWHTRQAPLIEPTPQDEAATLGSVLPGLGETMALMVTFPPDAQLAEASIDPQKAAEEFCARVPGLAEAFELDGSGYHTTQTIDYGVIVEGEMLLDLGNGREQPLRQGDVVVQVGTRHAWRNRSNRPARMFFVLIGAKHPA